MARAAFYPGADHASAWFASAYPGAIFSSLEKLLLHTTEGSSLPAYGGGAIAPNFTGIPDAGARKLVWWQHFPAGMSSRALRHARIQPTNGDHVVQAELVGTCVRSGPGMYWPQAPDWALAGVAELAGWLHAEWGLELSSRIAWRAPDAPGDWQRLSDAGWDGYRGILGHQHCPQNDHRDPGALDIARLLHFAGALRGSDMPTVSEIVTGVLDAVPAGRELNIATLIARSYEQSAYNTGLLEDLRARVSALEARSLACPAPEADQ